MSDLTTPYDFINQGNQILGPAMIVVMVETEGVIADSNNRESYGDAEEC